MLRPVVLGSGRMLIYLLLDAVPARLVFPESQRPQILPVYYALVLVFLLLSIAAFYARSAQQYRKFTALRAAC